MRYAALATDYDGTLAHDGIVADETVECLKALRKGERFVILVTGRLLKDLERAFPHLELFDLIVVENGALLYEPATRQETTLAEAAPVEFVRALTARGVAPIEVGRAIVATWRPYEQTVLSTIRDLALELHVVFNKGAVMVLPSGVNKATGLSTALERLGLSPHNVVGVGDAENDHAFLQLCECSAAVANALPAVKETADLVLERDHGAGVSDLIERLIDNDLADVAPYLRHHVVVLGEAEHGTIPLDPHAAGTMLIAGTSGSGKSTVALGILERLMERGYQACVVDPEGDYGSFGGAVAVGDAHTVPALEEIEQLLAKPSQSLIVNLLGVPIEQRPGFARQLLPRLQSLRARVGRPHWVAFDEAHHLFPRQEKVDVIFPRDVYGLLCVTVEPQELSRQMLDTVTTMVVVGKEPDKALGEMLGRQRPRITVELPPGEALLWTKTAPDDVIVFRVIAPKSKRLRHRRKYAIGDLAPEKSFYFRGPEAKLNLRAQNLAIFRQLAEGVDDETWSYHLQRGEFARWFKEMIGDAELAQIAEEAKSLSPKASREHIVRAIEERYTASA